MSHLKRAQRVLLIIFSAGLLFVIIPAVLFANSQDEVGRSADSSVSQTVPTRTPVLTDTGWLPILMDQRTITPTAVPPTETPTPTSTPDLSGCLPNPMIDAGDAAIEAELASAINSYRANNSLTAYTTDDRLVQAARRHAQDMAVQVNNNPHIGSDGSTDKQRIAEACYVTDFGTEIVVYGNGMSTVDTAMNWWKNSSTHNSILLHPTLDDFGPTYMNVPESQFKHYWTVTFGDSTPSSRDANYYCTQHFVDEEANRGMSISAWQSTPCSN